MAHHHHAGCGHEHHEDGHGHDHDHDHDGPSQSSNLFSKIDLPNVVVLNSEHPATNAIKPWHERMNEKFIESDADDQIIIRVPFTGSVKLRSMLLRSGPEGQTPTKLSLFANEDSLDFDDCVGRAATQEIDVVQSSEIGEYTLKPAKFSNVRTLTLFCPSAQGADEARISYLSFTGDYSELKEQPVITVYEAQANPADHEKIHGLTDPAMSRPGM